MSLFGSSNGQVGTDLEEYWSTIPDQNQLEKIIEASDDQPQLIYKHSHRCSVCIMAKEDIEASADTLSKQMDLHFVNVVHQREVSNHIASNLDIRHESPQAILLANGEVVWHGSHWQIKSDKILQQV